MNEPAEETVDQYLASAAAPQTQVEAMQATITAQRDVIAALVASAEERAASVAQLGTQYVVEQRTARLHHSERVLRSVIEALDGAVCIVGVDGTILDVNRRWLNQLLPYTHPTEIDHPGTQTGTPGGVGSDFFTWCATAHGMPDLLAQAAVIVRDVTTTDRPDGGGHPVTETGGDAERSVKGRVGPPGQEHWVVVRVHPVQDHDVARAVVTLIDITEGMQTQEQLRRASEEAQRQALVANATDSAVIITLPDGTIEWVNAPFTSRTGYSRPEAVGRRRRDLVHGACQDETDFTGFLTETERGHGVDGEFLMASRQGLRYWAHIQVRPVLNDGQVAHLVWVEQDVTTRRDTQHRLTQTITQAEQLAAALSQEKTLLTGVISAIPQLVFWKDGHGRYVGCNAAYLAFRGLSSESEILGLDEAALDLDDAIGHALRTLETQVIQSGTAIVDRKIDLPDSDSNLRALLLSVLPLTQDPDGTRGVIGVGADITHARELERQLAQANRLESIGSLAAGIAHEINTPIQYVSDNTQFIADSTAALLEAAQQIDALLPPRSGQPTDAGDNPMDHLKTIIESLELDFLSQEIPGALAECREGLGRVTEIVRAMKDYAHPGSGRSDIDVNRAIESTVQVCRNEWKYVAQVNLDLAADAGTAPCFEGELKQVILNMIVNAAQAIHEDHDRRGDNTLGTITITTRRGSDDFVITITDDGPGMNDTVSRRVFDPFFTTKDVGKGTGQGLSLAHAVIVTKHQGRIQLDTAPGHGATFTLHLPLNPATTPEPDQVTWMTRMRT